MMNISFSPPDITEAEIQEVAEALRSGWITTGPRTKKLEKLVAEYVGAPRCVCLNSQTACAEMALRLLGIGPGDEVITSAYTYTASASVIDHVARRSFSSTPRRILWKWTMMPWQLPSMRAPRPSFP